ENADRDSVLANMPWAKGKGDQNGYATEYRSDSGGSLMDYLWLASGSCHAPDITCGTPRPSNTNDFVCSGDSCLLSITDDNIFRIMNDLGISWKIYAESYEAAGGRFDSPDDPVVTHYYRRHNGATWYSDIIDNISGSQGKIVDFSTFASDLANDQLPRFVIIVPNGLHDAHDGSLADADNFLRDNLNPLLAKPYFQPNGDGLLLVTFDECGEGTNDGCDALVYTALIGPKVRPGTISSAAYRHENALKTILLALGANRFPGASADPTVPMADFFSGGGEFDIEDHTWNCVGDTSHCGQAFIDSSVLLDDAARKFPYQSGGQFTDATWATTLTTDFTNATNFTLDFLSLPDQAK